MNSAAVTALQIEWIHRLADQSDDFVCVCRDGHVRYINSAGARQLAASHATDLIGRPLADLLMPGEGAGDGEAVEMLAVAGQPRALWFRGRNGASVPMRISAFPISDGGGASVLLHGAALTPMGVSEHDCRRLVTLARSCLCLCTKGAITFINPAGLKLLGAVAAEDVIGRPLVDFVHGDYAEALRAGLFPLCDEAEPVPLKMVGVDRRDIDVELVVTPLGCADAECFVVEARDVSERQRIVDALTQARDDLERRVEERTRELRRLSRQNEQILNSAGEGIIGLDASGIITFVNPSAAEMTGWQVDDLIGQNADEVLLCDPAASRAKPGPRKKGRRGHHNIAQSSDLMLWRRDRTSFPVELALAPIEEAGESVGSVMVFRDSTERKRIEEKLRLAAAVFETTAEAIMVLDASFRITTVNPAFTAITGYAAHEVRGRRPSFLAMSSDEQDMLEAIWDTVRREGRWDYEQWNARKKGDEYAERLSITAITDDSGILAQYVVVFSDITQRKLDEERIRYQANYDGLTGLPNRSLFMDRLNQSLRMAERTGQRVGLMFIDLDGFKLVNDTLGHDIGDELLKEAAKRLMFCVRHGDTVARLGGDEFTIIMPNLGDLGNVPAVAVRIIEALEQPFLLKGNEASVSASIGITTFPDDAINGHALLKNADAAMYRAKERGKANYQFFTAELNSQVGERMVIKTGLSKALEREEFVVYYQPKCELATGRLTGAEALLRWRSPEMGMVSPVKFIPVMEDSGLIGVVGEWVLEMACRQHKAWRDSGHPHMRVAVNLSVRQLRQGNLTKTVENVLSRVGIDPSGIELEITESMIMSDTENAVAVLRALSDMGIQLAMDDFGTGYSSLSYLKRFPLHTIKIDRSFIADIATDPDDLEIIRTIITMGHSLRRRIVAEGVETEEQRTLLRRLRCDEMQGYLLSPPVPAAEIDRLLASMRHGAQV